MQRAAAAQGEKVPARAGWQPALGTVSDSDALSRDEAWQLCVRRQRRLLLAATRMGLAEQAEDLVHDTFVDVMKLPRLYRAGFDALLDTVLWRHCAAARRRLDTETRLRYNFRLLPGEQEDHSQCVVDRLYAVWLLDQCRDKLDERKLRMLDLVSQGYSYNDIASDTGVTIPAVAEALRYAREKARTQLQRVHTDTRLRGKRWAR
jgi:DNA-directed RNA polymerase specialized sigma24 family protein